VRNRLVLLAMLLASLGCRGPAPTLPRLPQDDSDVNALLLNRLDRVTSRLGVAGLEVALSARPEPGAWAWPAGPIHVSRALLAIVDDDELAAAIAHELGHLHADGTWRGPLAALGNGADGDAEARADEFGCRLLAARGVPPEAAVRLLEKIGASVRGGLADRIARARAVCGAVSVLPAALP
jgi:Zn-dependent protease with chaperone function